MPPLEQSEKSSMELQFKHLLFFGITMAAVQSVCADCNKNTIKYMLIHVCGFSHKRSFTDKVFHIMSQEEIDKRFNEIIEQTELRRLENNRLPETEDDNYSELFTGKSRSRKLEKRSVLIPQMKKPNGERTDKTTNMRTYEGDLDELLSGIIDGNNNYNTLTSQDLFEKCCTSICSYKDFKAIVSEAKNGHSPMLWCC